MEGSREEGVHFPDAAPDYVAHISEDGEPICARSLSWHRHLPRVSVRHRGRTLLASLTILGSSLLLSSGESCTTAPRSIIRRRVLRSLANTPQECSRIALLAIMVVCRTEERSSMTAERFLAALTLPNATQFPITQVIAAKSRYLAPMRRDSTSFPRTTKAGRSARRL